VNHVTAAAESANRSYVERCGRGLSRMWAPIMAMPEMSEGMEHAPREPVEIDELDIPF